MTLGGFKAGRGNVDQILAQIEYILADPRDISSSLGSLTSRSALNDIRRWPVTISLTTMMVLVVGSLCSFYVNREKDPARGAVKLAGLETMRGAIPRDRSAWPEQRESPYERVNPPARRVNDRGVGAARRLVEASSLTGSSSNSRGVSNSGEFIVEVVNDDGSPGDIEDVEKTREVNRAELARIRTSIP